MGAIERLLWREQTLKLDESVAITVKGCQMSAPAAMRLLKPILVVGRFKQLIERVQQQDEEIALLQDEINILQGEKNGPCLKVANSTKIPGLITHQNHPPKKRSGKKRKTQNLLIHEDKVIKPDVPVPPGARFKGYRDFVVQDLSEGALRGSVLRKRPV